MADMRAELEHESATEPVLTFQQVETRRGRTVPVPSALPRLGPERALANVILPLHLNWSAPGREYHLRNRRERARVYEIVLREGRAEDIRTYIDGLLLVDLWDDLVLPADLRATWQPLIDAVVPAA